MATNSNGATPGDDPYAVPPIVGKSAPNAVLFDEDGQVISND